MQASPTRGGELDGAYSVVGCGVPHRRVRRAASRGEACHIEGRIPPAPHGCLWFRWRSAEHHFAAIHDVDAVLRIRHAASGEVVDALGDRRGM